MLIHTIHTTTSHSIEQYNSTLIQTTEHYKECHIEHILHRTQKHLPIKNSKCQDLAIDLVNKVVCKKPKKEQP